MLSNSLFSDIYAMIRKNIFFSLSLFVLMVPVLQSLINSVWSSEDQSHGPFILMMALWAFFNQKTEFYKLPFKFNALSILFFIIALLIYFIGRFMDILMFQVFAFIPLLCSFFSYQKSWKGISVYSFPLLFLLFAIPLPGNVVDALTSGLKGNISALAETILYAFDYPIARTGVTIFIGPYQLLVADACSGLHSLFSLFSLGVFYLYIQNYKNKIHNFALFLCIAPVAFSTNVIRVLVLVLVTYYFGNEAGQGIIHNTTGFFLFFIALCELYLLDKLLAVLTKRFKHA